MRPDRVAGALQPGTQPEAGRDDAFLSELESASPETRAAVLARLQRGAGNASVSRLISRASVQSELDELMETSKDRGTDIPPHAPGDASEDLLALAAKPGGLEAVFGAPGEAAGGSDELLGDLAGAGPTQTAAPEPVVEGETSGTTRADTPAKGGPPAAPTPAPNQAIDDWSKEQPKTNAEIARLLLAGKTHEFVKFLSPFYTRQIIDIEAGKPGLTVYTGTSSDEGRTRQLDLKKLPNPLGALLILEGLARGHARRWLASPTKKKEHVEVGDLARYLLNKKGALIDAHARGESADLYSSFKWDGPEGPGQVMQVLDDLPKGRTYLIGLPMQGQFFSKAEYLAEREKKSIAEAGPGGTPKDVVQPSLVYWKTVTYTAKYNPAKGDYPWDDIPGSGAAVDRLRSGLLKDKIKALGGQGTTIEVMPDYDNHIHITLR